MLDIKGAPQALVWLDLTEIRKGSQEDQKVLPKARIRALRALLFAGTTASGVRPFPPASMRSYMDAESRPAHPDPAAAAHADPAVADPTTAQCSPCPLLHDPALERRVHDLGTDLLSVARRSRRSVLSGTFWSDKMMDWASRDQAFKLQLFRFIDAFPSLGTPGEIYGQLVAHLTAPGVKPPPGLRLAVKAGGVFKGLTAWILSRRISSTARRFIAAADAEEAVKVLEKLWLSDTAHTVTLLGEKCLSLDDARKYQGDYLHLLRAASDAAAKWPARARAETDHLGPIPRANISIKASSLHPHLDPANQESAIEELLEMMLPILSEAKQGSVQLHLDMEESELKGIIFGLLKRCAETSDVEIGVVLQAYLRSAEDDAQDLIGWTRATGRQITVRLVKGAYWDYEKARAERTGQPVPVWTLKSDSDACFERVAARLVDAIPKSPDEGGIKLALGSHNLRSIVAVLALLGRSGLPENAVELQMLYGMAEGLKAAAVERELRLREYIPIGPLVQGMAYLVRRLLENTSNESWLKLGSTYGADPDDLLASPHRSDECAADGQETG
ncbi:MAG: proline dehydrogenase family protein [Phycisphaerales bacterium]|nr:MAG: proline dehydrogenase family protein [Phycisphaerales bacterium]